MARPSFPDKPINGRTKPQGMTLAKATQLHRQVILAHYWAATELRMEEGEWLILARRHGGEVFEYRDRATGTRYHRLTTICDEFRSYAEFAQRFTAMKAQEAEEQRARALAAYEAGVRADRPGEGV